MSGGLQPADRTNLAPDDERLVIPELDSDETEILMRFANMFEFGKLDEDGDEVGELEEQNEEDDDEQYGESGSDDRSDVGAMDGDRRKSRRSTRRYRTTFSLRSSSIHLRRFSELSSVGRLVIPHRFRKSVLRSGR